MNINDIPGNSNKERAAKQEKRTAEIRPVDANDISDEKGFKRFFVNFIRHDVKTIRKHIINNLLIPRIEDFIIDSVNDGLNMAFDRSTENRSSSRKRKKKKNEYGRTAYETFYDYEDDDSYGGRKNSLTKYQNVYFNSKGRLMQVIDDMKDYLDLRESIPVGELYQSLHIPTDNPQVWSYGWTDLSSIKIMRYDDKYYLDICDPYPIKR